MVIYDYENRPVEIELPDKPIASIYVHVLSGDETGIVTFTDGETIPFDASQTRVVAFNDGCYLLNNEQVIRKWLDFKPHRNRTASYERMEIAYEE